MPSPLAHIGVALALGVAFGGPIGGNTGSRSAILWRAGVLAFAGVAPDLDLVPVLWDPEGLRWHHGPSHSLCGALLIGLFCSIFSKDRLAVVLACLAHVPMDWSTGTPGAAARYGVPLFWPYSETKYIDSAAWFGAYGIDGAAGLSAMFSASTLHYYLKEAATVGVVGLMALGIRRLRLR